MDINQARQEIHKDVILSKLMTRSKEKAIPLFLVGGYLRDLLLGRRSKDYDFTLPKESSTFIPDIEEALGYRFFKVGKDEMNTATYRVNKEEISVDLTFRQGETIEEDLGKRDFTVNAIAFSLRDETFHWVERSVEDIGRKLIRAVSDHSIDQDPLRMLRAIRYSCTLEGFKMDVELKKEISAKKEQIGKIAAERIKTELDHILLSSRPGLGVNELYESSLLLALLPELIGLESIGQGEYHHLNVLPHVLLMIEKVPRAVEWITERGIIVSFAQEDWLSLYYAALFHDIGKQDTYSEDEEGKVHFYYHESYSCQRAERNMDRLRFSNQLKSRILNLIQHHMRILNLSVTTKEGALKRLINEMGEETPLLVVHTLADKEASRGILSIQIDNVVEKHCLRILELFKEKEIVHPPPLVTGHDVMALGVSSGPKVGEILRSIRQKQVEGEIKTREDALKILKDKFLNKE